MLQRPSAEKQKLVHAFQAKFNSIDMEVRVLRSRMERCESAPTTCL